jgi:tripartite-type tricarboxylate transporter receptor subunit TctC
MKASVRKATTPPRRTAIRNTERQLVTQHPRRRILSLAAGAAAVPVVSRIARGQAYPSRPVHLISSFAAGGANDIIARVIGQWLSDHLSRQFIIENRPGAGGNVGTEAVVRSTPDGHTLLMAGSFNAINATLYDRLNFSFIRDIAPVASVARGSLVLAVHPSVPAKTVPEFVAYSKANPGKINMASAGSGSTPHLTGELFKAMAGVDMVHVPYRGDTPALIDLIGGQVQVYFSALPASIEHIKAGRLRALAVTSAIRSEALPDIPTVSEFVPGYEASIWWGVGAPKGTPSGIVDKLNREIDAGLANLMLKARLADLGATPLPGTPAEFGKLIVEETEKWAKVIRAANIKPE